MKIACIALNQNLIHIDAQSKIINYISKQLFQIGEHVSLISYLDNNLEHIRNIINDRYDLVFFVGTESSIFNHNIKDNLSRLLQDKLESNSSCYKSLSDYCTKNNKPFSAEEEMEVCIPSEAIPLCSNNFYNNGFMFKSSSSYIVFLPSNYEFAIDNYTKYIYPLLKDISNVKSECVVLKCYGILEKDIRTIISEELLNEHITIQILNKCLDTAIYLRYNMSENLVASDIISSVCNKLNKFIYATEDVSLESLANDLLSIQHKKIAIGETITLGNIVRRLSNANVSNVCESYVFANFESVLKSFRLDPKIIEAHGEISVNSVYELDNLMLEKSNADLSLFVLGDKELNICYIAIGDFDGIHVYKNKIASFDDLLIDNITDMTLFYLIKKLRQNDLQFI